MIFSFDTTHHRIHFRVKDEDIVNIHEIEKTMQTKGWQILMQYHNGCRDVLLGTTETLAISNQAPEQNARISAMTGGMRMFITLAYDFVKRAKEYVEKQKKQLEAEQRSLFEGVE